jgi:hypothetical protein
LAVTAVSLEMIEGKEVEKRKKSLLMLLEGWFRYQSELWDLLVANKYGVSGVLQNALVRDSFENHSSITDTIL